MRNVLVTLPTEARHRKYFESIGKDCHFEYVDSKGVTEKQVAEAGIIIGNVPPAMLKAAGRLEWLQLSSAGANQYCEKGILPDGVILTNATGGYGLAIAEHMLGSLLTLQKKLHLYLQNQEKCLWKDQGPVTSIWNSTTLVIGLGDIGSEFAKRMKALGSYVIGVRRKGGEKPDYVDELYTTEHLDDLLPRADIVAMSLPDTPQTYHIMNRKRLGIMKEHSFLLNVGRGTAIDQIALKEALDSGHLGGCSIDVTDPEPLPADDPLWKAKNILITPHISGQFHLQETLERIIRISGGNLDKFLKGEPLVNVVDLQTGYRAR